MMKTYLITLLYVLMVSTWTFAQEQERKSAVADKHFKRYEYARAVKIYTELADKKDTDPQIIYKAAESYHKMNRFEDAEAWYARYLNAVKDNPDAYYSYAEVLMINGKFEEAKKNYKIYVDKKGMSPLLQMKISSADSAALWMSKGSNYSIMNVGNKNTNFSEWGASYESPTNIVFTSDRILKDDQNKKKKRTFKNTYGWNNRPYLKLYQSSIDSNSKTERYKLAGEEDKKTEYHNGPITFSPDGQTAYLTQTTEVNLKKISPSEKTYTDRLYTRRLQIIELKKKDGKWTESNPFKYNNVNEYSVAHAALSKDGRIIYFASDMPGGKGKTDIWYCEKTEDGSWGKPQNCGDINTLADETFPTIDSKNDLHFSSDGMAGMGGLDIFKVSGSKSTWTKPENLLYPINSTRDDFWFITLDNKTGFISSNRKNGKGDDDLYRFTYTKPEPKKEIITRIDGIVLNKKTMEPLANTTVLLFDSKGTVVSRKVTDQDGLFMFPVKKEMNYRLRSNLKGFYPVDSSFSTKGINPNSETFRNRISLLMDPLDEVGKTFVLNNIYYDLNKSDIRPDAALVLNELVNVLRENPGLKIELSSHTDSRGSDTYNLKLSQRRALSAVNYIIAQGISKDRLVAKGYGETKPVNKCVNNVECTDYEHQENRRTEFMILAF